MKKNQHWGNMPLCNYLLALFLTLFAIPLVMPSEARAQRFQHPGVPFTRDDLNRLKQNITQEPWLSAYNDFKNSVYSSLTYVPRGPFVNVSRAPDLNNLAWKLDMVAIHNLAMMWIFTGDSAYARKATNLLDAWAVTNTVWGGSESMLDIGDHAHYWATAADILKSTFAGWTATNTTHVNNYFANVLYPTSFVPYPLRDQNKGAIQLKIALGAAAFLDDATKFNQAIEVYRMDAGGGLRNSLPNGEVGDAGRDDHWRVQAAALAWGAEVAYKQGIDMFAELNNRLLAIGELYHKFSFDGDTMTFIPFGGYASYWTNWGIKPGITTGDMTNIIKAAYYLRKGIATPQTDRMRAVLGGAGGNFLFLKTVDTSTATPLPPVVYPGDNVQPVTHLTNMDIGNAGMAGSATYNNGVWTVNGAGTSLSNAFNYTFQKMAGNSAVVVKVNSMSESAGGCGIMVRQSLAPGANYWNIQLNGTGGVGRHWQPKAPWWLKMERVGTRIFGYHSQDGINWTNLLCFYQPNNYTDSLFYGFYTISNNVSALNTATFTNVAFSQAAPAGAPQITSATAASTQIGSAFSYSIVAGNSPVSYSVDGLPDGLSLNSATGVISGTPTTLGTTVVTLYATNAAGTGTAILILRVSNNVAPAAPAGVTATVVNTGNVLLNWTASANATSYRVKRSLNSGGPYTTIATGITATSYTDVHPVPEEPNYYVVTALADTLESNISNQVNASVPPAIPGKPVVTTGNGQLQLSWAPGDGAITYNIKRSAVTGGPYATIANQAATTFTDSTVTNGTPYYYVISSVGSSMQSGNSPEGFGMPGAGSYTWVTSAVSADWSDTANWVERAVPASPAIITFKSTEDSVLNNNLTNLSTSRIVFDTTAVSYTIAGNPIVAGNEIMNNSSNAQALNTPLVLSGDLAINAKTQNLTLNGGISGTGNVKNIGRAIVYIKGLNTYSGNTTIWGDGSGGLSYGVGIAGVGTGTSGAPTAGPLGTGKIIMDGGTLHSEFGDAVLYNDIEVLPGKRSYLFEGTYAIALYGKITGSGSLWNDCNTYAGLQMNGDNSGFTGLFVNALRSGNNRLRFNVPQSGSANAIWNLDANGVDCQSLNFPDGTIHFGALTGRGYFRNNAGGAPIMSVGALNTNTWFSGTINGTIGVEKVGTGDWEIGGNHTYTSATTVRNGRLFLVNNATSGTFVSPLTVVGGALAGTGRTTGTVIVGTGTGTGAALEPGNRGIGTLTTTAALTMHQDATFKVEMNLTDGTADKMITGNLVLNNAQLEATAKVTGSLAPGTNYTIIDNAGAGAVAGTFNDLPELALVAVGGYDFRITYKGGNGNDVMLLDDRMLPVTISSSLEDTTLIGRAYTYTVTAIKSPSRFTATGLPAGLSIDTTTGVISGAPTVSGTFAVLLGVANDSSSNTATLNLVIKSSIVDGLIVASGDAKNIVEWNSILDLTYNVKRATVAGGPYTTLASNLSSTKYTDATVTNGSTYYYVVSSVDAGAENSNSDEVIAKPNIGQLNYYPFDETGGARSIDTWGANHGTLQTAATRITGLNGQALKLDGTASSYVTLPAGLVNGLSTFTVSAWVKMTSLSTWMRVFDLGGANGQYMFLSPQAGLSGGNSIVRYAINNGSSAEQSISANYAFPLNTWVHLAVTQSAATTTLYINGVSAATSTAITLRPSNLGNTTLNYLGKSQFSADPMFNGAQDEFRLYSRALSAAEIATIYSQFSPPVITSKSYDTTLVDRSYTYTITSSKPVTSFAASELPTGLSIDTATGIITGTPTAPGIYTVSLTASTGQQSSTTALTLAVKTTAVDGLMVASGDGNNVIEWEAVSPLTYIVKRAATTGGPYTTLAQVNGSRYTDSTVANSNIYYYVVAAAEGDTVYGNSTEVIATPGSGQFSRYAFEELTGGKARDEWGARHATLAAAAVRDTGYTGLALKLNGTATAYASLPANIMSGLSGFTISSWVKMDALATWMRLFDFGKGTSNYMFFSVQTGVGVVRYAARNGGAEQSLSYNYAIPLNTWTHFAVTYTGNTTCMFINGVQVATSTAINISPAAIGAMANNYLGKSQFADPMFKGTIDDFRIYNRALSAAEIANTMTTGQTITVPPVTSRTIGDSDFSLQATVSSGLPLTYSSADTNVAVIDAQGNVRVTGAGTVELSVNQAGDARYKPAVATGVLTVHSPQLSVLYKDGDSGQTGNNSIRPYWRLLNQDSSVVSLKEITMRYWISPENYAGIQTFIDYAALGNVIAMKYVPLTTPYHQATGYVEFGFDSTAGLLLPTSESGVVQTRIANTNWAAFDETNDYSYAASTGYSPNTHITLYRNGKLIAGVEPAAEAPVTAVSAYTLNDGSTGNSIRIGLKLNNIGNVPVDYSDITAKYWFSTGDSLPVNYWVDYAQLGSANINGAIQRVLPEREGADHYLELAVNATKGALFPYSNTGNIQFRISRSDWGSIQPADDYSWLPQTAFDANTKVTVYYKGALIWGTEPAATSGARKTTEQVDIQATDRPIKIFPNPATDILYIHVPRLHPHAEVRVTTIDGRVILNKQLKNTGEQLSVSNWKAGCYFVTIRNGAQVIRETVIKQ